MRSLVDNTFILMQMRRASKNIGILDGSDTASQTPLFAIYLKISRFIIPAGKGEHNEIYPA